MRPEEAQRSDEPHPVGNGSDFRVQFIRSVEVPIVEREHEELEDEQQETGEGQCVWRDPSRKELRRVIISIFIKFNTDRLVLHLLT